MMSIHVGGVLMPAWMDIIGRLIPVTTRGRFFAFANLAAGAGGFAGSFVTASILAAVAPPASYGACFVGAAMGRALSSPAPPVAREPAATGRSQAVTLGAYLSRIPALLGRDPNLAWFLAARAFAVTGSMAGGFYTVYALRVWDAPAAQVGVFTTLLFVGQMAGNAMFGWLADRRGHLLVITMGLAATLAGNLVAVAAPTLGVFCVGFVMLGAQIAAMNVSTLDVLLEIAPGLGG